jgi:hypothetical protein
LQLLLTDLLDLCPLSEREEQVLNAAKKGKAMANYFANAEIHNFASSQ